MRTGDTIVAPCTPPGRAARAVIRASGPDVGRLAAGVVVGAPGSRGARAARMRLGTGGALPVLALRLEPGASYTGQDTLEVLLPGNPALVERAVNALLAVEGVRAAEPGEFTARAYIAGRMSLAQAEGVAATIGAETETQLAAARELRRGQAGRTYARWSAEMTDLLALVEAGIDFTDQEGVVAIEPGELRRRLAALAAAIESRLGGARAATDDAPLGVLVGAPNAGKSTLFNALLGRRRSVVADEPGTTRDVLVETLDLSPDAPGAGRIRLADPAGLDGAPAGHVDERAQRHAREAIAEADVLVHCDPSGRFDPIDGADAARPTIRVRTKADLPGHAPDADLAVCALDGRRLGALRRALADAAWGGRRATALVLPRHRRALEATLSRVRAASGVEPSEAELVAGELRAALDALGELTGRVHPDDVIGRVFATFCVGK